jgi:hypothetical protein
MSDERFDRIDTWQRQADRRFDHIDEWQRRADARFEHIDRRFERLEERIETVDRHTHVLHEETMAAIAATQEFDLPSRTEMRAGFVGIRELLERQVDPLITLARHHEIRIRRLEGRQG